MDTALADESLMKSLQEGQVSSAGLLYQRYKKVLLAFFMNCTHHRTRSEDLVQLTFEKMIRYRSNFSGTGSFKSWLFAIARNVLHDEYRKDGRWQGPNVQVDQHEEPAAESQLVAAERKKLLKMAMLQLKPEKREMLALIKLQGMKYREVADIYQINESTLKVNVFRTMQELKKILAHVEWDNYK